MKRPFILFLIMIALIAAAFGCFLLMGEIMESSYTEMAQLSGEAADQNLQIYLEKYKMVKDTFIPELDKGKLDADHAALLTEYVFDFYYRGYDRTLGINGNDPGKDIEELDDIRNEYMLDVLHSRMFFTDEDMEAARDDIMENGLFHASEARKYADRYCERYR